MPAPLDPALATDHHLLVLTDDVLADEVEVLASSRFAAVRWGQPSEGSDRGRRQGLAAAVLKLTRLSSLEGPYRVDRELRGALGLPAAGSQAYVVHAPRERGEEPWADAGDRDGIGRAFPDGLPVRDELRVVTWLVAAARRLGGAVRVAGSGVVLVPDPAAAVDLTVWSDIWLDPGAGLAVVRQAVPRARLDLGRPWQGPPRGTGSRPVRGTERMPAAERAALHAGADEHDLQVLLEPDVRSAYGVLADLDADGMIAVQAGAADEVPPVLTGVPWAQGGAIAYRVSWEPESLVELGLERPGMAHRVARGRTGPLVNAVARALHAAVGGEVTDMMDFVVDPADL